MNHFVSEFLDALDGLQLEVEDAMADERPGSDLTELLDELFPELAFACENRWVLELVLRYCDLREKGRT